ncbi:uncharacterized protein [Palaemon carinicauda]|uniref:uncharacterized protein n=1 Tax=Palaemon carinicauda TaxID=392227 RepID=UPI0035B5F5BB
MAESSLVQEHLNAIECKWKFVPVGAPWFGARWERLIGLLKTCLKKVIGQDFLSFSELSCIVTELEAIINDRPLSYTPGDLDQLDILTPNHLILGRRLRSFPREIIDWKDETKDPLYGENEDVGKQFWYITKKCDDLWKRWEREYLASLRETHRVGIRHESWPKMGDVVLIHDEGPRSRWKLGQIVKLHVGPDDVLRMVTLKPHKVKVIRMEFDETLKKANLTMGSNICGKCFDALGFAYDIVVFSESWEELQKPIEYFNRESKTVGQNEYE